MFINELRRIWDADKLKTCALDIDLDNSKGMRAIRVQMTIFGEKTMCLENQFYLNEMTYLHSFLLFSLASPVLIPGVWGDRLHPGVC